jgi:tRNA modification GTPase
MHSETIFALATPAGKSGVAIIRISGARALEVATILGVTPPLIPRKAHYCALLHPTTQQPIDHALLLYFPAPHSFTGEDIVEIQCHGSKAVIHTLTTILLESSVVRYAEAGEFTKRALENGKMDLLQAEALIDLINAETDAQRHLALRHMEGDASHYYNILEEAIIEVRAFTEAHIDFPEDDIPLDIDEQINEKLNDCIKQVHMLLSTAKAGRAIREGVQVAIIGLPNAGKSTLLNSIAEKRVAITSSEAGTTRDAISYYKDINGIMFCFTDTAGLRDTNNAIEKEGIAIAKDIISNADYILCIFDISEDLSFQWNKMKEIVSRETIWIGNKIDVLSMDELEHKKHWMLRHNVSRETIYVSAKEGVGVNQLLHTLSSQSHGLDGAPIFVTRERHIIHLTQALAHLEDAKNEMTIVLKAQHLIYASAEIGSILGKIDVEKILDKLFSSFCIGK